VARLDRSLKWETLVIIGARFIPGFSSAATIAVALSKVSSTRFMIFNVIGSFVWALAFGVLGYVLGQAVEAALGDIKLR
jgi:membrane protein DedA with SNARE-associated domain